MSTFRTMRLLPHVLACAASVCLVCCIHAPVGHTDAADLQCGSVGPVEVRLRSGVASPWGFGCHEGLEIVRRYLPAELHGPWTVEWTGGWAGLVADERAEGGGVEVDAMTYPSQRLIVVTASHPWKLEHEFGHAMDVEQGKPNLRDRGP